MLVKSAYNGSMTFDESAVRRDSGGRFSEKSGLTAEVTLEAPVDPELVNALDAYGITVNDVPLDHEGKSIVERWNEKFSVLAEERHTTVEEHLTRELDVDFGRLRGGPYLAWPEIGTPMEDWETVRSGDSWEGRTPVAVVHTRNGGGNRECYCDDDDHAPGCVARAVEIMEEHPAHLMNEDNSWDTTYANFAFKVERESAHKLFKKSKLSQAQETARNNHKAISEGRLVPWSVFPRNPETEAKISQLKADSDAVKPPDLRGNNTLPSGLRTAGLPEQKHLDALRRKIALLDGEPDAVEDERDSGRLWYYDRYTGLKKTRDSYDDSVKAAEAVAASRAAIEDPTTPPALAYALEKGMQASLGISYEAKKLEEREQALKRRRAEIEKDAELIEDYVRRSNMRSYIAKEVKRLTDEITWPGEDPAPTKA